jgi:hypothetical protein
MAGDFTDSDKKMRVVLQKLVKDGLLEGVQMELDSIRGLDTAYLSATASATADTVYTVPNGKTVVSESCTLTNAVAAAVNIDIYDGTTHLDHITIAAQDSVVIGRRYRFETSIICYCSAWLAGTSYSFSYHEFPDTNRQHTPP